MKSPRALQQLQHNAADLAHRAQILLLSASGWSVPAIAEACGCCRRAIRGWIHAFEQGGLLALLGKPRGRPPRRDACVSAMTSAPAEGTPAAKRQVPVIPLTVAEMRHLLNEIVWKPLHSVVFALYWSTYRRYKQALAMRSHYRKRGAEPPEFEQVRL